MIGKLVKFILFLILVGFVGIVIYAYVGPWFGSDFSEPQTERRLPVNLNAD